MQVKGVIDSLYTKTVNTRKGPADVYHAIVEGYDINLGFRTNRKQGEYFDENIEQNKFGEYQVSKAPANGASGRSHNGRGANAPANSTSTYSKRPQFPVEMDTKDTSIIRQNSLTNARETVMDLLALQGGDLMASDEEVAERIISMAYQFADFSTGQREVKMANAKAAYEGDDE